MPVYEYEPDDRECLMCDGRIATIQGIDEPPLQFCPYCGLEVRRVVSNVTFNLRGVTDADRAGKQGFTTWRKVEQGKWEKISGPGADMIVGDPKDVQKIQTEKTRKVVELD